jgi:hypothetical protein
LSSALRPVLNGRQPDADTSSFHLYLYVPTRSFSTNISKKLFERLASCLFLRPCPFNHCIMVLCNAICSNVMRFA